MKAYGVLYIVRGLPGSGKSTLAKTLSRTVCEADDWFYGADGVYRFDPAQLGQAHEYCHAKCQAAMMNDFDTVAVANTFCRRAHIQPYLDAAKLYGYRVCEVTLRADFGSIHGLTPERMAEMRASWED